MKIRFLNGSQKDRDLEFPLSEITIGRDDCNVLQLMTAGVSRCHALLKFTNDRGWVIFDRNSTNGVKVNEKRISGEQVVFNGDKITIGEQEIQLCEMTTAIPKVIFNPILSPGNESVLANNSDVQTAPGVVITPQKFAEKQTESVSSEEKSADYNFENSNLFVNNNIFDDGNLKKEEEKKHHTLFSPSFLYRLMITVVIATGAIVATVIFRPSSPPVAAKKNNDSSPLSLFYEKFEKTPDNIFRFSLSIEGKQVIFTVDDVKNQRHPDPIIIENASGIALLHSKINQSRIWNFQHKNGITNEDSSIRRRLVISEPQRVFEAKFFGPDLPQEIEAVEEAINYFAKSYGLQTYTQTAEVLLRQAEDSFNLAEDRFENRLANHRNLRDSIIYYRIAVNNLDQFRPRPPMWKKAKTRLAQAEELRKDLITNLDFEVGRLKNNNDVAGLLRVFRNMMELSEEDSRTWTHAKQQILILNQIKRRQKR